MEFQATGKKGVGGLDVRSRPQTSPPAECVDDQRRANLAPIGTDGMDAGGLPEFAARRTRQPIRVSGSARAAGRTGRGPGAIPQSRPASAGGPGPPGDLASRSASADRPETFAVSNSN